MSVVKPYTIENIMTQIKKYTKHHVKNTLHINVKTVDKNKKQISIQELKRRLL